MAVSSYALRLFALCAALLLSHSVFPQGKDDLWEMTMKVEMEGMPTTMPARTEKMCIPPGRDEAMVPKGDESCRMVDAKRSGNKFTFKIVCSGREKMTGEGEFTYAGDRMSGTMRMKGERINMTQTLTGRRIGNCDATAQQQKMPDQYANLVQENKAKTCVRAVDELDPSAFVPIPMDPRAPAAQKAQVQAMVGCDDYKPKFCAKASEVGKQMLEPKGYVAAHERYRKIDEALRTCGQDPDGIRATVCNGAVDKKDWSFALESCPAEMKAIAAKNCVGRDYTEVMFNAKEEYRAICARYAPRHTASGDGGQGGAQQPGAQQPAAPPPSAADAIEQSKKALRNLLKF